MAERDLVAALHTGNEAAIWEALGGPQTPWWGSGLWSISSQEAFRLLRGGGHSTRVALTDHPDGRVREAAVRALQPQGQAALPALMRRANDWVATIARLAQERAIAALSGASDADLSEAFRFVYALSLQRRADHGPLIHAYRREVARRNGLARRLRQSFSGGKIGLWAFRNLIGDEETLESLAADGLKGQPGIQVEAARIAARDPASWPTLMASRNPQLRRIGLDIAPAEAREAALIDVNAGVRNDARYLLGKRDFASFYRALLPKPGAVSGLGETGNRDDADALVPLLRHSKADVRARAVEAIFRLRGDDAEPLLLGMLTDPVPKVQKASVEALVRSSLGFDPASVLRWPLNASLRRRLLQRTPRWAALLAVLREADTLDGAEEWLTRWAREAGYGRIPPKPEEIAEARRLLQASPLSPQTAAALHDALQGWPL